MLRSDKQPLCEAVPEQETEVGMNKAAGRRRCCVCLQNLTFSLAVNTNVLTSALLQNPV